MEGERWWSDRVNERPGRRRRFTHHYVDYVNFPLLVALLACLGNFLWSWFFATYNLTVLRRGNLLDFYILPTNYTLVSCHVDTSFKLGT